jgi:predicted TIM-barrel fold metal-dependent hydrolase
VIDGWAHCGIRRFRPIDDVMRFLDRVGIEQAVIVQPLGDFDNDYLLEVAARHRDRLRSVGVVAADRPDRAASLVRLAEAGCAGVRMAAADLSRDPTFAAETSAAGLAIAVHASDGAPGVASLAGAIGGLERPVIVTHLGMPTVVDGVLVQGTEILPLAAVPNVFVLLSGLAMACPYPYGPLRELVHDVVMAFGPQRVMWGSNYPLTEVDETTRDLELIRSEAFGLTPEAVAAITAVTARQLWFDSLSGQQ